MRKPDTNDNTTTLREKNEELKNLVILSVQA